MKKRTVLYIMLLIVLICCYAISTINHPRTWFAISAFIITAIIIINKFLNQTISVEDFNEKYKNYLEEHQYGLALDNPRAIKYLDQEFQELIKIPGFQYSQIKGKYGHFCFYADNVPSEKMAEIETNLKQIYNEK